MASWRLARPPQPAMPAGLSSASASANAATPVTCAPSAPARATISGWPSTSSAAPLPWTTGASALTRLIMVRLSVAARRTSTAATSPAPSAEAIHGGAVDEGTLRCRDVFALPGPGLLRRRLQRAAVAEGEPPWQRTRLIHSVEVRGRLLVRLAAGEKRDAGHGRRHAGLEQLDRLFGDFLDAGALGGFLAWNDHVGLEHHAFEGDLLIVELLERGLNRPFGDRVAAVDVVVAVHQHFRLDDRHDPLVLAERRIARERMRVGHDAVVARHVRPDVDHRAPLGEFRAERAVFDQPLAQTVKPLGNDLARTERQRLGSLVDLDTGQRARLLDQLDQRGTILGCLTDGLVIEDDA